MKNFEDYFSRAEIIERLCKIRAKIANNRNKKHLIHQLTSRKSFNYHIKEKALISSKTPELQTGFSQYQRDLLIQLNEILPPRRKWVKLGKDSRIKEDLTTLSSTDKNILSLKKTISKYEFKSPTELWLLNLNNFIENIQFSITHNAVSLTPPIVIPKLKEEKIKKTPDAIPNTCRPLCLFSLRDRIILSITNKFLTQLFDKYFLESSYAFRSIKNKSKTATLSHHDCIDEIIAIRKKAIKKSLWVVECDMEKFFDTVNHSIINKLYNKLLKRAISDFPLLKLEVANNIFKEYLRSYCFNKNVPKSNNLEYWKSYKIPNGEFGWVGDHLLKYGYYKNLKIPRIGIPQGGALSGLIANIVLHEADKNMKKLNVSYLRFCDDMLVLSLLKNDAIKAKDVYVNSLKSLKLVPHKFPENENYYRELVSKKNVAEIWKKKSKGPYKWASINEKGFEWIGFVGYEIDYQVNLRVRKKSLNKELSKQNETIQRIYHAIKTDCRRKPGYISESAINRLIGMAVGRVTLKNYKTIENDLCWKNGFKKLTPNKYLIQQVKHLDRNRNKLFYDLKKYLKQKGKSKEEMENILETMNREVINYDKPFSYYYQIIERQL
ncbi:MAG: reverse transcriptase/maturase family protein [Algoriphagus sp.]|uniref:reverse transcriptase/maturase family protein n=1 Tax=Algoriphagus sp. TaxID=1872435 RepID=UPI002730086E|nr:reverse transcriptase/maturase family protein [Algoriphagus sp.]MDP2040003.1 reverse transcriptase/maturase family protein [Algoriphagus sp.]MDP3470926.1 reverse transcriptase/maturase family protein [Algoriphagus sp.]